MKGQRSSGRYQVNGASPMADDGQHEVQRPQSCLRQMLALWRTWVIIGVPILLLPIPLTYTERAGRCAYAVLIMAIYWMTEAIPMAVTALLPVVLMPWLGVLGAKELSTNYLKDTNMLFFGGLIVAVAVEKWNLHKRIALRVLLLVGSQPRWLMFGFMATTAFLSMWISNTATTAMMVPIAQAVLSELEAHRKSFTGNDNPGFDGSEAEGNSPRPPLSGGEPLGEESQSPAKVGFVSLTTGTEQVKLALEDTEDEQNHNKKVASFQVDEERDDAPEALPSKPTKEDEAFKDMCKGLTLCVAYAANIGGTATLTGTGPNLVMKGQVDTLYGGGTGINFSSWFIYSFPNMMVTLLFAWFWLQILFLGFRETFGCCCKSKKSTVASEAVSQVIRNEYNKLGSFSFAEVGVLGHFILLALLWLSREPEFVPGWSSLFPESSRSYVTDATVAMTISVSLFIFPSRRPNFLCFKRSSDPTPAGPVPALLDWNTLEKKMAWSVVLVLGGGFALANACQKSGLSDAIGQAFVVFTDFPTWLLVLLLSAITAGFTEVTSNVATATIFLPILAQLAESISVNPLYLLVPTTVATSFAFMLPVATPPNAIVFAYGNLKIFDMVKAGVVMNLMCVLILTLSINTWGYAYFNLANFPDWANRTVAASTDMANSTLVHNCTQILGLGS